MQRFILPMIYNTIMKQENECEYGIEGCSEDDFESMCDDCKNDRGQAYEDARMDTYD